MKCKHLCASAILAIAFSTAGTQLNAQIETGDANRADTAAQKSNWGTELSDEEFIAKNIHDNRKEVEMAQMAIDKSENENVKAMAKILVEDHTKMIDELTSIGGERAETSSSANPQHAGDSSDASGMLANATGAEFDDMWIDHMLIQHKIKLGELHQANKFADDPKLKSLVQKAIPEIRNHRDMLTALKNNPDQPVTLKERKDDMAKSGSRKGNGNKPKK